MYRLCYQWLEQTCLCEENRWQLCSLLILQEILFVEQGDSLQKLCRGCAWLVRGECGAQQLKEESALKENNYL